MTRFDGLMRASKKRWPSAEEDPDAPTSKHSDVQTSKAKSSSKDYVRTTLYLTKALHKKLKMGALEHDLEMSDIAEQAIAQWLEEHS